MNHVYRIVWSAASNTFIAIAETRSGKGKRSLGKVERAARALALAAAALSTPLALAGPASGQVVAGQGSIAQSGSSTTINQTTNKLAINWQSFNIGAGESVTFHQPGRDAIALNRVLGSAGTEIHGSLSANGQVFVINPNGVLFGKGSSVSAGGLAASTLGLSDADFMSGNFRFSGDSKAQVINQGSIRALDGGYAALIGSSVSNQGLLSAKLGSLALAAGSEATLEIDNGSLTKIQVSKGALRALAENQQLMEADGGRVILTAKALDELSSSAVNNEGVIQARSLQNQGGSVRLVAEGAASLVAHTGSIDAGSVSASAQNILQAGSIRAQGEAAIIASDRLLQTASGSVAAGSARLEGGQSALISGKARAERALTVAGDSISLAAADLSAGSSLRVGGGAHGQDADVKNASSVKINAASALSVGDGGSLVAWSDQATDFYGASIAGERSFTEISSKGVLKLGGSVKAGANSQILFDPTNIVIASSAPSGSGSAPSYLNLANPQPNPGEEHGQNALALPNGNVVAAASYDNFGGFEAGAAYLYDGSNGALISTLIGSPGSQIGSGELLLLTNGNYLVASPAWVNGAQTYAGAVTWGSQSLGVSGLVSSSNSLVGSRNADQFGFFVKPLANGNYLAGSQFWSAPGGLSNAGAVAWGNGASGSSGVVSGLNALVGTKAGDRVGTYMTPLANGNYVIGSPSWDNGSVINAGAATWGDGATGITGQISAANSLVGTSPSDLVANGGVTALANGHYAVASASWNNGAASAAGAVTWGNGASGTTGVVSTANSVVGSQSNDMIGDYGVAALSNGNYVIMSPYWNNALGVSVGAATWVDGSGPSASVVSAVNSLVGSQDNDKVGEMVWPLANGHYVVVSASWDRGAIYNTGAVTWGSGAAGIVGEVSAANSLVGSTFDDQVGLEGVTALSNGNYVINSPYWDRGAIEDAGASTWGNGLGGTVGDITLANSLLGAQAYDEVGASSTALSNGNYVVGSAYWSNGAASAAGAATWGSGSLGVAGEVSAANSLVGTLADENVGEIVTALSNGNYVVQSPYWSGGGLQYAGAVTWGNGASGIVGAATAANSFVGSSSHEFLGQEVVALSDGHYAIGSSNFSAGGLSALGSITWGSGLAGVVGSANSSNSLFGSIDGQLIGYRLTAGSNGSFISGNIGASGAGEAWLIKGASGWGAGGSLSDQLAQSGDVAINPSTIQAAAGAGSTVTLQASNTITVNSDLHVDGSLIFEAGNSIVLNANVSSQALGDALVMSSDRFINNAGSNALSAPNGRWLVYSSSPANNAFDGLLSGSSALWGAAYGSTPPASVSGGNRYVFALAPTASAQANAATRAYDGSIGFGALSYVGSGLVDASAYGGVFSQDAFSGALSLVSPGKNAGSYAIGQGSLAAPSGYAFSFTGALATITPKALAAAGVAAASKTYDGSAAATLDLASANLTGEVVGDDVQLSSGSASGLFADKNAGANKAVSVSGLALTGADAGNYALNPLSLTADIYQRALAVTASAQSKTYDGSAAASVALSDDRLNGDLLAVSHGSASFSDKSAGVGKTVTVSGISLSGADAANYIANASAQSSADIAQRALSVVAAAQNKAYDGTAIAVAALSDNRVAGDALSVSGSAAFADKNAGLGKTVTVSGISLSGADAANYTANATAQSSADIARRALNVTASAQNKTYDGTASAAASLSDDRVSGDDLTLSGSAAFADKNAGQAKTVNVTGIALSGADAANYTANATAQAAADIAQKALSVSGVSAQSKTYDGTALAQIDASGAAFSGMISGDDLSIDASGASGSFSDKSAGLGKAVSIAGLTLSGADAANYLASLQTSAAADIAQRALSVSATAQNKTYDGTAAATALLSDNRVSGDDLTLSGSAAFADKNAGLGKTVNVTGLSLSGADAANYALASSSTQAAADIARRALSITATAQGKTYDGTAAAVASLSDDRISGDDLSLSGSAAFADKNAGLGKTVSVTGISLSGADAANYIANATAQAAADIARRSLSVSGVSAQSKTYDGTVAAQIDASGATLSGKINGDDLAVDLSGAAGAFADKNAGVGKTVSIQGVGLSGADAANYEASLQSSATADIQKRILNISATAQNKTYDGNDAAVVALSDNRIAGDEVTLSAVGSFHDKTAGTGKIVTINGVAASGADAGNYVVAQNAIAPADILKRVLHIDATARSKTYDGTDLAEVTLSDDRVQGDDVTLSAIGRFHDKTAGTGKIVTINGVAAEGLDAFNYVVAQNAIATADIAKKALSVSGVAARSKTYDGTSSAQIDASGAQFSGVIEGDDLTLDASNATGAFADKNAGVGKTVNVTSISLSGADAGNYAVAPAGPLSADISPKALQAAGLLALDKRFDGSREARIDASAARLEGLVAGDEAALAPGASGLFDDASAGSNKPVAVLGLALSGADARNYALDPAGPLSADILPAAALALPYPETMEPSERPSPSPEQARRMEEELRRQASARREAPAKALLNQLGLAIERNGVREPGELLFRQAGATAESEGEPR